MSREDDFSISELRRKREQQSNPSAPRPPDPVIGGAMGGHGHKPPPPHTRVGTPDPVQVLRPVRKGDDDEEEDFHVDMWRMVGALQLRWKWILAATLVMGLLGFAGGYYKGRYVVAVKLIRRDVSSGNEYFKVEPLTPESMLVFIRSWDIARRVEAKANPPVHAADLMANTTINSEEKSPDIVAIIIRSKKTNNLPELANLYAAETVAFTREFQIKHPREVITNNIERAAKLDEDIRHAVAKMAEFRRSNEVVDPKKEQEEIIKRFSDVISLIHIKKWEMDHSELKLLTDRLAVWKKKLFDDRARYTEQHPEVVEDLTEIARLESEMAAAKAGRNAGSPRKSGVGELIADEIASLEQDKADLDKQLSTFPEKVRQHIVLQADLDALDEVRKSVEKNLLAAQQYEKNAEGFYRISSPAAAADVDTRPRMKKARTLAGESALVGLIMAVVVVLLLEIKDRTMKTVAEVERQTGLRVISTLGDLDAMTPEARDIWAFRAWTIIGGQLNTSANQGMVCGISSSGPGEGRSTWIKLLGDAATRRGLRVLTVSTKPSGTEEGGAEAETIANEKSFTEAVAQAMEENMALMASRSASNDEEGQVMLTLSPSALAFPAEVVQQFNSGNLPAAHIPLPGWVWNRERRQQWQLALSHWMAIDNLVLLIELPPASVPESVLLAENLPQILWLVDSGKANISETKQQLDMMRHAKCRIVGALLNHEPDPIIKL